MTQSNNNGNGDDNNNLPDQPQTGSTSIADALDAILAGLEPTTRGVLVIASTNRMEDLDPALLRPFRFQDLPLLVSDNQSPRSFQPNEENAYFTPGDHEYGHFHIARDVDVIAHELPHGLPGQEFRRSPEMECHMREMMRIAAGKRFREERPRIVAIIEGRAGTKLSDEELGGVLKANRQVPQGSNPADHDYEVMALEAQEIYAHLETVFADELAKPAQ